MPMMASGGSMPSVWNVSELDADLRPLASQPCSKGLQDHSPAGIESHTPYTGYTAYTGYTPRNPSLRPAY